jgi:hypothetical protein
MKEGEKDGREGEKEKRKKKEEGKMSHDYLGKKELKVVLQE